MKIVYLFFCSLIFCISASAQNMSLLSTYSCGKYAESRVQSSIVPSVWLLGFLSGANLYKEQKNNLLKDVDRESIFLWMDKYCKEKPLDFIDDGGQALMKELYQKSIERNNK